jgi:glycerophosphoryl diester phosphodiesterase
VESFDRGSLESIKRIDTGIRTAALFEPRLRRPVSLLQGMRMVDLARRCGADEIALHKTLISHRVVEKANKHALPVVVWTVDNSKWIERARSLGLKALITNDPRKMVRACR